MEEERGNLYEEMGCFNPNTPPVEVTVESGFSQPQPPPPPQILAGSTSNSNCSVEMEELSEFLLSPQDCCPQAPPPPPPCDHHQFQNNNINLIHQMAQEHSNWDNNYQDFVNLGPNSATTPDLLSLLHLPRCSLPPPTTHHSMFPNSFSDIMSSSSAAAVMYDPLFHLNFPLQPQRNGSCLLGVDDQIQIDAANGGVNMMYYDGGNNNDNNNNDDGFDNGIIEFNNGRKRKGRGSGKSRTFPTERERRVHFNDRFFDLKNLIPNPTKIDRASIVGEAIDYIKELLRTIEDLKMLVEKKRFGKFRSKKRVRVNGEDQDQEQEQEQEQITVNYKPSQSEVDQSCFNKNNNNNNTLRCSWLKRKSKVTEVDVRIIDDEVTIKLVQKKKINCLLFTTKVLDQLQLDLHHVAGGQIGESYSFLFNTKICEGSCVYASGIADSVMEVVEKQYMEAVPTNGY